MRENDLKYLTPSSPQTLKRLWRGDLMDQMTIDVDKRGSILRGMDVMISPDLVEQGHRPRAIGHSESAGTASIVQARASQRSSLCGGETRLEGRADPRSRHSRPQSRGHRKRGSACNQGKHSNCRNTLIHSACRLLILCCCNGGFTWRRPYPSTKVLDCTQVPG